MTTITEEATEAVRVRVGDRLLGLPPVQFSTLMAHGLLAKDGDHYRLSTEAELLADPGSAGVNVARPGAVLAIVRAAFGSALLAEPSVDRKSFDEGWEAGKKYVQLRPAEFGLAPQAEGRDTGLREALIEAAMGMPEPSPVYYRTPEALACAITLHDARAALKASYSGRTPQEILMAHIRATFPLAVKAGLHVGIKVTEASALSTKEPE